MKKKTPILILCIITFAFVCTFFASRAISKYVTDKTALWGEETEINYTVNSVFQVRTQQELFEAINQGYSYIQLDKEIENPLIVTQKAETLDSDLILDLNGIEIQRNGYEPILNIKEGVRLTVVDTSEEQTGGLYNPVGSVFNVVGGTLTVVTGTFESGPRYSEYYSYNTYVLHHEGTTKRTLVEDEPQKVVYTASSENGAAVETTVLAPIIKSYPTKTGEITYNHGNLYFDREVSKGDVTINADTYCYYRTNEDHSVDDDDLTAADWNYCYYVNRDDFSYYAATLAATDNKDDYVHVTIYGYENTIKQAEGKSEQKNYYAAVQMQSGSLEVQKGEFFSYFGVDKTACVNAVGGSITVKKGNFSSRIPDATYYSSNSVTVKEKDSLAFNTQYFSNYVWASTALDSTSYPDGARAQKGESYCILNGGDAKVALGDGEFYSSNSNIISMSGGDLSVAGGKFTKKTVNYAAADDDKVNVAVNDKLSAISIEDGNLKIISANYSVIGKKTTGIYIKKGTLTVENSAFTVEGEKSNGIYSSINTLDGFKIIDTGFVVKGDNATGVYSENGRVNLTATSSASISSASIIINGDESYGVHVGSGGSVSSENYSYKLSGDNSRGIYSEAGQVIFNKGSISLESDVTCYGVYAASDKLLTIDLINAEINVGYKADGGGAKSGTVAASAGVFLSSSDKDSYVHLNGANIYSFELGIVSNGGSVEMSGKGEIKTNMASAVAIRGGSVKFSDNSEYTTTSRNTTLTSSANVYAMTFPVKNSAGVIEDVNYVNTDGIYVNGGSFTSNGKLTVMHTGLQNSQDDSNGNTYNYNSLTVTSYAVRVLGGKVTITQANITAIQGGGVYAGKTSVTGAEQTGDITLGVKNDTSKTITVETQGALVGESYDAIGRFVSDGWKSYKSITGGHAIELNGGNITVYGGTYTAMFGNGVYANGNGNIEVYGGTFNGYMKKHDATGSGSYTDITGKSGPSAYYGLKVVGGAVVNIYGGIFDGGNGGAFVTGVTSLNKDATTINSSQTAHVYIYEGTFGNAQGEDSFNVYDDAIVVFGAGNEDYFGTGATAVTYKDAIVLHAHNAPIAVNPMTQNKKSVIQSQVYVYYGTYNCYASGKSEATYLDNIVKASDCGTFYKTYNKKLGYVTTYVENHAMDGDQNNESVVFYPFGVE